MLRFLFPSALLTIGAVACSGTTAPTPEEPQYDELATSAASSKKTRGGCKLDKDCCTTSYCDNLGYGPPTCRPKATDGSYCAAARECVSGACINYACSALAPACAKIGAGCKNDVDCCVGSCTYDSYGPTPSHCYAPQPNGSSCASNRACASGHCDQYECKAASGACASLGTTCKVSADCCGSGFCDTSTYGPWKCTAPRAAGQWCEDGAACQSGSCVSYVCK